MKIASIVFFAGAILSTAVVAPAAPRIAFDPASNCIWVAGFPEESPGTLDNVLLADRSGGWGKVRYDASNDTYAIDASLWIGNDQDAGTFFQIGRKDHPRETAVVRGDVWVRNPRASDRRLADKRLMVVNRLTLGSAVDAALRPTLKIACSMPQEFGLFVGSVPIRDAYGGDLFAYNSVITAAVPDKDHAWRGFAYEHMRSGRGGGWHSDSIRLVNSTVAWAGGNLIVVAQHIYYVTADQSPLCMEGTTFEHCQSVTIVAAYLVNTTPFPSWVARDCIFRDVDAVSVVRPTTFLRCRFEGNKANIVLDYAHVGVTLIDCEMGPQKDPFTVPKTQDKRAAMGNPGIEELRSIRVQVVDKRGRPIPGAIAEVIGADDNAAVQRSCAVTGRDGLTPGDVEKDALLVTARRLIPTDDPKKPEEKRFSYTVRVAASGYQSREASLDPAVALGPQWLRVEVKKE